MLATENNVVSKTSTASDDNKFALVTAPLWFHSLNVVCLLKPAFYGDRTEQVAPMYVNEVVYYEHPVDLSQLYFINQGAGNNAKINATGVLVLKSERRRLGIPIDGI